MALRLELILESAETSVVYRGVVELSEGPSPVLVEVARDANAADGLRARAEALGVPDALRPRVESLAASIGRKAVRAAHKDGVTPPRRLRRWRTLLVTRG